MHLRGAYLVASAVSRKVNVDKNQFFAAVFIGYVAVIVLSYVGYVLCSYSRIEDNLKLTPDNSKRGETEPQNEVLLETEYTAVTQNLGFGAYTQDFTFFMDGGEKSRAESKQSVINCITEGAKTVKNLAPDFVFFQETDTYSDRSYHVDERELLYPHFNGFANVFAQNYHSEIGRAHV